MGPGRKAQAIGIQGGVGGFQTKLPLLQPGNVTLTEARLGALLASLLLISSGVAPFRFFAPKMDPTRFSGTSGLQLGTSRDPWSMRIPFGPGLWHSVIQGNPPLYEQHSLWQALFVSEKWIPFPALGPPKGRNSFCRSDEAHAQGTPCSSTLPAWTPCRWSPTTGARADAQGHEGLVGVPVWGGFPLRVGGSPSENVFF